MVLLATAREQTQKSGTVAHLVQLKSWDLLISYLVFASAEYASAAELRPYCRDTRAGTLAIMLAWSSGASGCCHRFNHALQHQGDSSVEQALVLGFF